MQVDRCYCYQQSFADLKRIADEQGAETVADLQEHVLFGENCRLCHPYVRRMLKTGEIVFDEVIEKKP
ncbi:MAG: (2Fe-2S)-binding protein [Bacteroidetes bacterium QS_1_65_9]|jgi:bacterioferritin-associated ferredoxin|nr:MAG: (2Fe-2S)-binding protein [Bacteroidetes bacterium QS_1_65_9]